MEREAPFHSFLSWVRCLSYQDCSDFIITSKKELVEVTNDKCDRCDWEHRTWPRLCCPPLNNNAVRRDFYSEPLLILHNKKKKNSMLKKGIKSSALTLRWFHHLKQLTYCLTGYTHTHIPPKKRYGNSNRCPKAWISVYNDSCSNCILRN